MRNFIPFLAVLTAIFIAPQFSLASTHSAAVQRSYPIPNAFEVPPQTNIGISAAVAFDPSALEEGEGTAVGSLSGSHVLLLHLSLDRGTLICHPVTAFAYNERVFVTIHARLLGGEMLTDSFSFSTMEHAVTAQRLNDVPAVLHGAKRLADRIQSSDTLPSITISVDSGATPGTIYLSNFTEPSTPNGDFLLTMDEHGHIIRSENISPDWPFDFKIQPTGLITYNDYTQGMDYGLDSNWNIIETFSPANGYVFDEHELRVFPDGGYALLALSETMLPPTQDAPGLNPNATIIGDVIQIFDAANNEVFEWRGLDHYQVADAIHENLDSTIIDFEHSNSLDFDSSGNILLSNRHLCEITLINRQTGSMIWRFGGAHNQFKMIGDSIWFTYQHAARWLPNGHMILFDDANYDSVSGEPSPQLTDSIYINHSRAVEYVLDTSAMTATLVWQYHHTPETYSSAMGYVDRLPNGNTLISWGYNSDVALTEIRPDNSTVFEMSMDSNWSYRAYKYPDSSLESVAAVPTELPSPDLALSPDGADFSANFDIENPEEVTLTVCDILGRSVLPDVVSLESGGEHHVEVPTGQLESGTYYCELRLADGTSAVAPFSILN